MLQNQLEAVQSKPNAENLVLSRPVQTIQAIQNIPKVGPQQIGILPAQRRIQPNIVFNKNTISFFGRPYVPGGANLNQLGSQQPPSNRPK